MKINTSMQDDKFSVEESTALLHAIFQNYPDIIGMKPAPVIEEFLRSLRVAEVWETGAERNPATQLLNRAKRRTS